MKIKDPNQKKRVMNRLHRIEGQLRGVSQMIEDEASVHEVLQQLSAIRSAIGQAINEELLISLERALEKNGTISEKDLIEIRDFLGFTR